MWKRSLQIRSNKVKRKRLRLVEQPGLAEERGGLRGSAVIKSREGASGSGGSRGPRSWVSDEEPTSRQSVISGLVLGVSWLHLEVSFPRNRSEQTVPESMTLPSHEREWHAKNHGLIPNGSAINVTIVNT